MKTLPLIGANLKSFMRNWRSILLLVLFPLALIMIIFFSFNPDGLSPARGGVVFTTPTTLSLNDLQSLFGDFLHLEEYESESRCLDDIRTDKNYVCLIISSEGVKTELEILYDNTRDNVIYEVVERIKGTIDFAKAEIAEQSTSEFIGNILNKSEDLDSYTGVIDQTEGEVQDYKSLVESVEEELTQTKEDLDTSLTSTEQKINSFEERKNTIKSQKNSMFYQVRSKHEEAISNLDVVENIIDSDIGQSNPYYYSLKSNLDTSRDDLENYYGLVEDYSDDFDDEVESIESDIDSTREDVTKGKQYSKELEVAINTLPFIYQKLDLASNRLQTTKENLTEYHDEFQGLMGISADLLLNPYEVKAVPAYIPSVQSSITAVDDAEEVNVQDKISETQKDINRLGLQTLFPSILILLIIFLSFLIGTFVTLNDINEDSYKRILLIPKTFVQSFMSLFISTHIIIAVPIAIVLLVGEIIFQIAIFNKLLIILPFIFLLSSIFILLGMSISYLIRNKAMTMLVNTFLLIFFIFFSGFLLPVERMALWARIFTDYYPGKIVLRGLSQVFFYNVPFEQIIDKFIIMFLISIILIALVLLIKYLKEKR